MHRQIGRLFLTYRRPDATVVEWQRWRSSQAAAAAASTNEDDADIAAARRWLARFHPDTIPKTIGEVGFSRSSGPGGQNVNKVNSKATLHVPLDSLLPLVPKLLHPAIRSSRYHAGKSNVLVIQCDESRKQSDNVNGCYARLHNMIAEAGANAVPGETSEAQRGRVKNLDQMSNERRLHHKKSQSDKKSSRRGGGRTDY